jgi:myxalamid-type polyketide synthase MxaE and MxaD
VTAPENPYLPRLREAVAALRDVRAERDALLSAKTEPIAVVGLACRFPGASSPREYWRMLESGVDAVREIPAERWPADAVPGKRPEAAYAGLVDRVDQFDAAFFGISPREAEILDPQQRFLLEVAWEALEDAGQRIDGLAGTATGVFVGICSLDYQHRLLLLGPERFGAYAVTGNMLSTAAGRISYTLGLQGPAVSVDTACSSSLVSIALACQSLRDGESELAIAGGVNMVLSPFVMTMASETQALSPDGRCRTLDARANGFVRGEGCGMVVLKRLSDAVRDGDHIRAVIRGWAVNQDGRSSGLTAPNVFAQEGMLREALRRARVAPDDVGYVEMHGTGTPLGDPIEAEALKNVLGRPRADGSRCALGAVKTNIGHLEGAAGVAGFIKAVLALEHEGVPRNLHFRRLNPRISLDGTPLYVPTETVSWRRGEKRRIAGVSSFGISGTNAHVLVEEAPAVERPEAPIASSYLLPLSAKTDAALAALARSYADEVARGERSLADVVHTASMRRAHHERRLAVSGASREELVESLSSFARTGAAAGCAAGAVAHSGTPKVVFVFPGQGSQWLGMGRQLLAEPAFRKALTDCDEAIRREGGFSVLEELAADETRSRLGEIDVIQPTLYAIEVALASLWRAWGIEPDAVIGHSMGEVAAAHVAGILDTADAAKVICRRSRLLRRVSGKGAMGLVELSLADARRAIAGLEDRLGVAASNGPRATVLSGDPASLEQVLAAQEKRGVFCRRVRVDVASHSPQMEPLREELLATLRDLRPRAAHMVMRSTVTRQIVAGHDLDARYWVENLRAPVLFSDVTQQLIEDGHTCFVEVSPHPILLPAVEENLREKRREGVTVPSLRRAADERRAMLESVGVLYARGASPRWEALHPPGGRCVSLPTYPWQHERFWVDWDPRVRASTSREQARAGHPLLGEGLVASDRPEASYWDRILRVDSPAYLDDHRVDGEVVLPGAAYAEMALAAAASTFGTSRLVLEHVSFDRMLTLAPASSRRVQTILIEEDVDRGSFRITSRDDESRDWTQHAHGVVATLENADASEQAEPPWRLQERCTAEMDGAELYTLLERRSLQYGPAFRGVERLWVGAGEVLARVRLPERGGDPADYCVPPALLDACLQVSAALLGLDQSEGAVVPVEIERLALHRKPPRDVWVTATLSAHESGPHGLPTIDLAVVEDDGSTLLEVRGLRLQGLSPESRDPYQGCAYVVAWTRKELDLDRAPRSTTGVWVVMEDAGGLGAEIASDLRLAGQRCVEVAAGGRFERRGPNRFSIDPSRPEDYQRLFREALGDVACSGVVHCYGLDAAALDTTPDSLLSDLRRGCLSALLVTQELVWQGYRDSPRLVLVTRGAQAAGSHAPRMSVAQAPLWGLGRTIAMEQPDLACTRIDLSPHRRPDEAQSVVREILHGDAEDQVALRDEGRLVARLQRRDIAWAGDLALRADGTYVITGGLGGLGLSVARWMVAKGARHLVLVGRSEPGTSAREEITAMEREGAEVRTMRVDVSRTADVDALFAHIGARMPPVRGVVHAAAALEDRTLQEMTEEQFWPPIRPKVLGAWNLHVATRELPLDFFVMYSSAASLLGSPGQGNYAAANAFMDALAHARAASGLPAMSIQWGAFSEVGLAAAQDNRGQRLSYRGMESFTPEEGVELLERLIAHPRVEVGLVRMSVRQWVEFYPRAAAAPFLSDLREEDGRAGRTKPGGDFVETLAGLPPAERRPALERFVLDSLSRVLRLPPERIDAHAPFRGYGMDSLMSLEIRNRLEANLGVPLSAALLYTYPTTAALVDFLLDELSLNVDDLESTLDGIRVDLDRPPPGLSEAEAAAMLDERLSVIEDYLK